MDGFNAIINRHVMKTESAYSVGIVYQFLTCLIFVPFLFTAVLPTSFTAYLLLFLACVLWASLAIVGFSSIKLTHVSLRSSFSQSRIIFAFLLGVLLLSESILLNKVIGILVIFFGMLLLTYKKGNLFEGFADKGIQLTLISSFLFALVAIVDKKAISYFDIGLYSFLVYLIPGIFLLFFLNKQRIQNTKQLIKTKWFFLILMSLLAFGYYFSLNAYKLMDASVVFPILRMSTLVTVVFGMMFFKEERTQVFKKLLASLIVIAGALLLSGFYSVF